VNSKFGCLISFWSHLPNKVFLLICFSLNKLTINNLVTMVTMEHKQSKPMLSKAQLQSWTSIKLKWLKLWGYKLLHRGPLEYHYVLTKFHENLPGGSKFISRWQTNSHFGVIEVTFNAITIIQNFIQIHQSVQKVHTPQKFKFPPFWNGWSYGIN
jgi:hypothetical protein